MQPATFYRDQRIATHLGTEVLALDPARSTATLTGGSTVHYRRCVPPTGAAPSAVPVPGADHPDVRLLRSLISARALVGSLKGCVHDRPGSHRQTPQVKRQAKGPGSLAGDPISVVTGF
jgi:NADPH-dependent 2,4-dienoyl-CoA reductase/sulfur reductase-like enzyme